MTDEQLAELLDFSRRVIEAMAFDAERLDGGDIQDLAEEHGLIVRTKYDPAIHGPSHCAEPGEVWFEFAPFLKRP